MEKNFTDWWLFAATIVSGMLSALATWFAVVYTNKKTAQKYEQEKERQEKINAMVILKPMIKSGTFGTIMDELIVHNIRDRVLILSSEKDGFDFFDDEEKRYCENNKIFSIHNGSKNSVRLISIDVCSIVTTDSSAVLDDKFTCFVKLLRSNEEILFRICGTEQRKKIWEELDKNKRVKLTFNCKINYLTYAGEQILYEYETEIVNIPVPRIHNNVSIITNDLQISVIKDEYRLLDKITLSDTTTASIFRNLQDYIINIDRVKYTHKKIGEAQSEGIANRLERVGILAELNNGISFFKEKIFDPVVAIIGNQQNQTNTTISDSSPLIGLPNNNSEEQNEK